MLRFRSFFVAQIRGSGAGYSHRSLSTTNSKPAKFRFSEQNLNVLWLGTLRVATSQNKNGFLWSINWRHKPFCVTEQKLGRFVARDFQGCDLSEHKSFLWPGIFGLGPCVICAFMTPLCPFWLYSGTSSQTAVLSRWRITPMISEEGLGGCWDCS